MTAKVVAVINMKGGVGKTTISAHVMREFYRDHKKKVLLIDFDPQFNLTQTVVTEAVYDNLKAEKKTIFSVMEPPSEVGLFDVGVTDHAPPPPSEVSVRLKLLTSEKGHLDLVPGDFSLVKYSIISDKSKLDSVRLRFNKFISVAKSQYDIIIIDCNPSSSFITVCALSACSSVLVPVRPDRYSMQGLGILFDYVQGMADIHPKPSFDIVLNAIPRQGYNSRVEDDLRAHAVFGPRTLVNRLYQSKILAATAEYTGFATDKPVSHRGRIMTEIEKVSNELAQAWGF